MSSLSKFLFELSDILFAAEWFENVSQTSFLPSNNCFQIITESCYCYTNSKLLSKQININTLFLLCFFINDKSSKLLFPQNYDKVTAFMQATCMFMFEYNSQRPQFWRFSSLTHNSNNLIITDASWFYYLISSKACNHIIILKLFRAIITKLPGV